MATAAQRLAEAEDALHNLLVGRGVQTLQDQSGEAVTYTAANVARLRAYIAELKAELSGTTRPLRAFYPQTTKGL